MDNIRTKFFTTTSDKLNTIAIANGQVIALSDKDAWFYDMGGSRHAIISNVFVTSLPATGDTGTLYALNGTTETSGIYLWDGSQFNKICDLDSEKVKSSVVNTGKMYLTFVSESTDGSHELKKNVNIYINVDTREASIIAAEAKKATNDGDGNEIKSTYVKNVSASRSGTTTTVTVTKGDDSASTFDVEDTTYNNFNGASSSADGSSGLVPGPVIADREKFLRADGTWANPVNTEYGEMSGASASVAGSSGLVPGPAAGDQDKFLKGDGTWSEVETTDTKNTVGATDTSDKMFIVGAKNQAVQDQSYTNTKAYVEAGKVFSNGAETVNLSDSQALTNKTYEGYTLGGSCEKSLAVSVSNSDTGLPTAAQVHAALESYLNDAKGYTDTAIGNVVQFNIEVVSSLPASGQKANTIYLVPNGESSGQNVKTEYMWINDSWEIIGSTEVDLSNYVQTTDLHAVATSGDYGDLENKPTIPSASSTTPAMDGTASAGSDAGFAKGDHVHPTDTSRAAAVHNHTTSDITDFPTSMTPTAHKNSHKTGGSDEITPADIGAATSTHTHDNFGGSGASAKAGFVPAPSTTAGTTRYLREDGSWQVPPNDNTQTITGVKGSAESTYRTGDVEITAANIGLGDVGNFKAVSTVASQGLTDVEKSNARDNIGAGTPYTHPTGDGNLHVPATGTSNNGKFLKAGSTAGSAAWSSLSKSDVTTALGYTPPTTDTQYSNVTATTAGLAPAGGTGTTKFLRQDGTWEVPAYPVTGVKGSAESSYRTGQIEITAANIGLGNVGNFKAVSTVASQGLTDSEKSNARTNIGAGTSSFSGSYTDLTNKPTIPAAAANGTLTIQKNGTNVTTFSANQSTNATANITVPTKISDLTVTDDTTGKIYKLGVNNGEIYIEEVIS